MNLLAGSRRETLAAAVLIALAAVAVYANALGNGFALDDVHIIRDNPRLHGADAWRDIWLAPYWPNAGALLGIYRPLTSSAFALQWQLAGGEPWLFHTVSIILHAAATTLVLALLHRFVPLLPAALGALVFAVHPVHTEAVANVVGQAELLAAVAVLAAVLLHARRSAMQPSAGLTARISLLYAVALLAKESAITAPALLLLVDVAERRIPPGREGARAYARAMARLLVPMTGVMLAALLLRIAVLGSIMGDNAAAALPHLLGTQRLLMALRVWPEYLRLLVFPRDLVADYAPAVIAPAHGLTPAIALGALLLAGCIALGFLTSRVRCAGLAAGWFVVSVLTVSNLLFPTGVVLAERTLYLPSVALAIAIACGVHAARAHRRAAVAGVAMVVVLFSARTVERNPSWRDTSTVLLTLAREHPESYRAQWMLATEHWRRGDPERALVHWRLAYRAWPFDSQLLADYASFCFAYRDFACAVARLEAATALSPQLPQYRAMLAQAYLGSGHAGPALAQLEAARRLGGTRAVPTLRAEALYALGRYDQAAVAWRAALADTAASGWLPWAHFARALAAAGLNEEAAAAARRARASAPAHPPATRALDRLDAAIGARCLALEPPCADPLAGWGIAFRPAADSARSSQNARPR